MFGQMVKATDSSTHGLNLKPSIEHLLFCDLGQATQMLVFSILK